MWAALKFIIIRQRRSRSTEVYSRQTFPWTICRSVRTCVGRSVYPVHCGKMADRIWMPFGIVGRTGPGMRQVAGFGNMGIHPWEGVFLAANLWRAIVTNGDFTAYMCDSAATRPSSQITLGRLVDLLFMFLAAGNSRIVNLFAGDCFAKGFERGSRTSLALSLPIELTCHVLNMNTPVMMFI